jgi:hypothetical protein
MPQATVNFQATERHELKSLPEGFVELRRMSYGEKLFRQQMAMEMAMREGAKGQADDMVLKMTQTRVIEFEFANCIIDHNLTDEADQKLDFKKAKSVHSLHPQIGDEISELIDKMNTFEETEEAKN